MAPVVRVPVGSKNGTETRPFEKPKPVHRFTGSIFLKPGHSPNHVYVFD